MEIDTTKPCWNRMGRAQHGCFAAIPGSGPSGKMCAGCSLLLQQGPRTFVCTKYQELTRRKAASIPPSSSACRYYTPKGF